MERFFVLEVRKTARWAVGQMLPEKGTKHEHAYVKESMNE
jgi:hypothetical protein